MKPESYLGHRLAVGWLAMIMITSLAGCGNRRGDVDLTPDIVPPRVDGNSLPDGGVVPGEDARPSVDSCIGDCTSQGDSGTGVAAVFALAPVPGGETPAPAPTDNRPGWQLTEDNSSGVEVNDEGALTLASEMVRTHAVWIANATEGTVSRLDIDTGRETGRYPAIRRGANGNISPSRTAIDFRGDCWVANRYKDVRRNGSVTKIAANERDCVDRNGNEQIDTSRDLNDDGVISFDPNDGEYLGRDDECVLFTVRLGEEGSIPRALAIAPDPDGNSLGGNAWVGLNYGNTDIRNHDQRAAVELDGNTGRVLREVPLDLNPYGALTAKYLGQVWFVTASWQDNLPENPPSIQAVSFATGEAGPRYEVQNPAGGDVGSYGLAIDREGDIWVAGRTSGYVFRFEPRTENWTAFQMTNQGVTRGLVADGQGHIWIAHSRDCGRTSCGVVTRLNSADGGEMEFVLPGGAGTIGVDLDVNGRIWVVNKQTNSASRIDPVTNVIDEFSTGQGPYTYSDFTGHSLFLQFPRGYHRTLVQGCRDAIWHGLALDAIIPEDTVVEMRMRTAAAEIDLGSAEWLGPWTAAGSLTSAPGPVDSGAFLEVELNLRTMRNDNQAPEVFGVDLLYDCPVG